MKFKKLRKVLFFIVVFIIFCPTVCVFADDDDKTAIKILQSFGFKSQGIMSNIGRQIGWGFVTGLHWFVKGIEGVVLNVNDTLGGFFTSDGVTKLENKIFPLAIALFVIVILFIGILSMIKPQNFSAIAGNLAVGMVIAVGLPTFLSSAYSLTNQAITYLNSDSSGTLELLSDRILVDNITDNTMYDYEDFKKSTLKYKSYYDEPKSDISKITGIDPTELVDPDSMKHQKVWKNCVQTDKDGKQSLKGLGDGTFGFINIPIFSQHYYRWNINWFSIICTLLITAFALILSGIKIARLLYELVINQTMAQILALLDIVTAQRLKKCLQMLLSTFVTLFSVFFMLQVYIIGMSYISNVSNIFLRLICMLALAWAVIDGPNLFEQLFGIDAGIHSAVRTIYGIKAAGSIAAGGAALLGGKGALDSLRAKGITGTAKAAAGKAGSVIGGVGGIAAGVGHGMYDNNKRVAAVKNQFAKASPTAKPSKANNASSRFSPAQTAAARKISKLEALGMNGSGPEAQAAMDKAQELRKKYGLRMANVNSPAFSRTQDFNAPNPIHVSENPNALAEFDPSITSKLGTAIPSQDDSNEPSEETSEETNDNPTVKPETQSRDVSQQQEPSTIGEYFRSGMSNKFKNSGAYKSANRTYSLTRGSMMAHGDKKVRIETGARQKMQNNSSISHRQAVRATKKEMKK